MNNLSNLQCYEGFEDLESFTDETFEKYCKLKLETCSSDLEFIINNIYKGIELNICEIGGGNGKLMYALEKKGIIKKAVNYEVSTSRWKFAEKFKEWMHIEKVENRNQNFLEDKGEDEKFDCIVAVDMITHFVTNLYEEAEEEYFSWINRHLNLGGYAYFELQDYSQEIESIVQNRGSYKFWEEFPQDDPFQYGLFDLSLDENANIIYKKIYYERKTGRMDESTMILKPYTEEQMLSVLNKYGMEGKILHHYKTEGDLPPSNYLVLAQKVESI